MVTLPIKRKVYTKPKERRQESARRVKRLRASLGDSQAAFAKRLTDLALAAGHANLTGLWTVVAWEQAKREPDPARTKLLDQIERELDDGGTLPPPDPAGETPR